MRTDLSPLGTYGFNQTVVVFMMGNNDELLAIWGWRRLVAGLMFRRQRLRKRENNAAAIGEVRFH